jgi:hypothetical protein
MSKVEPLIKVKANLGKVLRATRSVAIIRYVVYNDDEDPV